MKINYPDDIRIPAHRAIAVYYAEDGTKMFQTVSDISEVGTLIDPESGDDLVIDHILIPGELAAAAMVSAPGKG